MIRTVLQSVLVVSLSTPLLGAQKKPSVCVLRFFP